MARGKAKEQAEILPRQNQALEMRKRGKTYRDIAAALNVDVATAHRDVHKELRRLADQNLQAADELRQLELERLDGMLNSVLHFVEAGSPQHVMAACKILDMRAKLLGLYAPVKQDVKVEDVTAMSDDERIARVNQLIDTARTRGTGRAPAGTLQ